MGLRFRKSIKIAKGVKVNLGKNGASLTVGVPGFHKTIHTSGRVTTSVGIPGTGISYVDTKNIKKKAEEKTASARRKKAEQEAADQAAIAAAAAPAQLSEEALRGIHKSFDDTVDWIEVARSETPPDESYDPGMWAYYHEAAPAIINGDIDAYLRVIYEVNPLDDLMDYGGQFQFGTDSASFIEVEFVVNEATLETQRLEKNVIQYYDLLQDYVCSTCIRVARDMFALLPVADVFVHAVLGPSTVVSARFDRETMSRIKFGYVDPSDVMERFEHRMQFDPSRGFSEVARLESGEEHG